MSSTHAHDVRAAAVIVANGRLLVRLVDGREVSVPVEWFPRLAQGTPEQQQNFRLASHGYGLHWPDLDEDIRVGRLLESWPEHDRAAN